MITNQLPVSCSVSALGHTCSTPPSTATPNCPTSRLTFSNRSRHCRIAPVLMSLLHAMPTQTAQHFSPNAVRLDCKKSCQNSGGTTPGSSTIFLQKAAMPRPNSFHPISVWIMDCRCTKHDRRLGPDRALRELMTSKSILEAYSLSGSRGEHFLLRRRWRSLLLQLPPPPPRTRSRGL